MQADNRGIFCDGMRRYGVPAPFFKRRQNFLKCIQWTNKLFAYWDLKNLFFNEY